MPDHGKLADADYCDTAARLLETGDVQGAGALFRRILKADRHNCRALYGLGVCYNRLGNAHKSDTLLQEAAKYGSKEATIYLNANHPCSRDKSISRFLPICMVIASIALAVLLNRAWHSSNIRNIFTPVLGLGLAALPGAALLQFATRLTLKFKPPYPISYKVSLLTLLCSYGIGLFISFFLMIWNNQFDETAFLLGLVAIYFLQSFLYKNLVRSPDNTPLGLNAACIVSLVHLTLISLLVAVIAIGTMAFVG